MKYTGTLMILDGQPDSQGHAYAPDCEVLLPKEKILVSLNFDKKEIVGFASLEKTEGKINYTIELISAGEKFELLDKMTPVMGGSLYEKNGNEITKFSIKEIGLTIYPSDTRLKPLNNKEK